MGAVSDLDVHRWFYMRVQAELRARQWPARELARRAGCSPSTFTRMGKGWGIALANAARIAEALDIPLVDMIAPIDCETCLGRPQAGFRCLSCGCENDVAKEVA